MQNKTKKTNNIDTATMEEMRARVVEQELSARSWKAFYEKMYYSLEAEKLEPLYKEYQERTKIRLEEERKQFEEFKKTLTEQIENMNAEDVKGEISLEEAN